MANRILKLCLITLLVNYTFLLWAQQTVHFDSRLSLIPSEKQAVYSIVCEWPAKDGDYEISIPVFSYDNLELLKTGESFEIIAGRDGNWNKKTYKYTFRYLAASARIEPFSIGYTHVQTQAAQIHHVEGIDLKEPKRFNAMFVSIATAFLAVPVVVLIRKSRARRSVNQKPQNETLEEKILKKIQAYPANMLYDTPHEFVDILSGLFTDYLKVKYQINNANLTDYNKLEHLIESKNDLGEVRHILEQLSRMKFSRGEITPATVQEVTDSVAAFIRGKKVTGFQTKNSEI